MKRLVFAIGVCCIFSAIPAMSQTSPLTIPATIHLPGDSLLKKQLLASINGLLQELSGPNKDNAYVLHDDLPQTSLLLDEMKNLENNKELTIVDFYRPVLSNLLQLDSSQFIIQISYLAAKADTAFLRASFTLLAFRTKDSLFFSSPLKQNTIAWKLEKWGNTRIHFKNDLNRSYALAYFKRVAEYDKKLGQSPKQADFYCADNLYEALKLVGVDYKSDYNGQAFNSLTSNENNRELDVDGVLSSQFNPFDPHDLWHDRLHRVLPIESINRPVDEGTAYLFGGSWGLSWQTILSTFKQYAALHPSADWLTLYNGKINFSKDPKYRLRVDYAINALFAQKIEREKGFQAVLALLSCGREQQGNENYFQALAEIAGIHKSDFNATVWHLIRSDNP